MSNRDMGDEHRDMGDERTDSRYCVAYGTFYTGEHGDGPFDGLCLEYGYGCSCNQYTCSSDRYDHTHVYAHGDDGDDGDGSP